MESGGNLIYNNRTLSGSSGNVPKGAHRYPRNSANSEVRLSGTGVALTREMKKTRGSDLRHVKGSLYVEKSCRRVVGVDSMIYVHSMERAVRYYPERPALSVGEDSLNFRQLHNRVKSMAGALSQRGIRRGDRLALLLPNGPEYVQLIYACSWLGVIVVPINTRLSVVEICYDPEAILAMIDTSGTTGGPKGVMLTHSNILTNAHNFNYWMQYREGGVYLHAAPIFHIADFPAMFAAPALGGCQVALPRFNPISFCEAVEKQRINYTVLVPTMINLLTQSAEAKKYDLSSLEVLAYGGSPMAPELVRRTRELLPKVKLVQVYGLSETGYLTGLLDQEHEGKRLMSCGRPGPGIDVQVADESGKEVALGQHGELVARGANVMRGYWNNLKETNAVFRDGMFRTGDIGYEDADG